MMYDVIVVGGGPSGASASYFNAKDGKKVLLIEKQEFPRDKICGDGVTGKSLKILDEMGLSSEIAGIKEISSKGVVIYAPNERSLRISIESPHDPFSAFSIDRVILDEVIFNKAKQMVLENEGDVKHESVIEPIVENDVVVGVKTKENTYYAKKIIGAGGYNCPISRFVLERNKAFTPKQDRRHYSSAIREYWMDIEGNEGDFEIHFIDGVLPGYFWIFPISEKKFNIGVGMLLADMDKQEVKLKKILDYIINESYLKDRFKNAQPVEKSRKGWLLPLGSPRGGALEPRRNYHFGCLLVGDSASLIDPFTGEGIGNALLSGKLTANYDEINAVTGSAYQQELWSHIGEELTNSHRLQKMLKKKWFVNWFVKKASKKPKLQVVITDMLHNKESQKAFNSKWFLLKSLLF
jgi:geranylgeranyl reductase family protein